MSRMIQIEMFPSFAPHLESPCSLAGMSLSDYLLAEIREVAERPTLAELQQRMQRRQPVNLPEPAAAAVRGERDAR